MKVLFLSKKNDVHSNKAAQYLTNLGWDVLAIFGGWGEKLPEDAASWQGDLIISYLSRWIVPEFLLQKATKGAINFHPAPPSYPGIGCINFALYNNEGTFGATCHHMKGKVDTGDIIKVTRFPIYPKDDVSSLLERTYDFQLVLFYDVIGRFNETAEFDSSNESWTREPYTRTEFNKLFDITLDMDKQTVQRHIRAVSFGQYQPWIKHQGLKFIYKPE